MNNTILIIDDMPENVKLLLTLLSSDGFEVLVAKNGQRGIQVAESAHPDLILLDIMMPGINGFDVCQYLKSQENTQNIPIIFMTALLDIDDKVKGFELGAADYITKPIQHEEVLARVTAHLNLRQFQQQLSQQNQQLQEKTEQLQKEIHIRKEIETSLQNINKMLAERTLDLQTRTDELEQRNLELDAFAHTCAHDLKNPVSGIINLTEVVLTTCSTDYPPDARSIKRLHLVERSGRKMLNIINDLLLLAGVSKRTTVSIKPLDMSFIIKQVIQRLHSMLEEYHAKIEIPEIQQVAQGYAPWVEEVWINYLTNAIKYGGQPPRLEINAEIQDDGMVCFGVRDNGDGLSSEEQAQLFTPFTRLHTRSVDGHGLGLSIVRQIVDKLGGQVGVESEIGKGSLFYFTLPKADSHESEK